MPLRIPRLIFAAMLVVSATSLAFSQQSDKTPTDEVVSADEKLIREGVVGCVEHYNAHDADKLTALFAPDARMTFRDGTEANGTSEIKQSFTDAFVQTPKTAISIVVDSIKLLTPDVAVEEGVTKLFPDGETLTAQSRYTVLHLKRDGRWLMQAVRNVEEESLSAYGELQSLEWLVGEWMDEGQDEIVEAKFRWDDNKSFLIEEFQVIREGEVVQKGTQRIGWDPQAKQVRSWIFDDAGGFGEAVWTPVDEAWVCKGKGVGSDGTSASATRTLTRDTADRVTWTATDRLDGGEPLPDLVVTMVRKPPQSE